jgi:hypothetical protein
MSLRNSTKSSSKREKSICKGLSKEDCIKLNECKYTFGNKRNFCRKKTNKLRKRKEENASVKTTEEGSEYFFTPLSTVPLKITPKTKTKRKLKISKKTIEERKRNEKLNEKAKIIQRFMKKTLERKRNEKLNEKAKIIQRFMKKTKYMRKAEFLKAVCSDAGECLAFGNYTNEIKKHFDGFANFEYAIAPINRIGTPSANGFINQIQYEHRKYKAYAVLKSAMTPSSDNLMYEYIVGQYVNKLNKRFPCFLETYGYYIYNTDFKIYNKTTWSYLKDSKVTATMDTLKKGLILQKTTDYAKACKQSKYLAILIQHLKGITPIKDSLRSPSFIKYELANVLFQIYMPLSILGDSFTHYDLHHENVNLYESKKDSYIHFHYHLDGSTTISFKSKYIAKIIDYGRSYFKDEETGVDSKKVYNDLCKEPKCKPSCGYSKGFGWMFDSGNDPDAYWISSQKRNKSHDLRLLNEVKNGTMANKTYQYLSRGLQIILQLLKYDAHYGTPEMVQGGFPNIVQNINDAALTLKNILLFQPIIQMNEDEYRGKNKIGDLHIYCGKDDTQPIRFVKA